MRYYSMAQVCSMFTVSRTTIGRWEQECDFPKRVYLGASKSFSYRTALGKRITRRSNCRIGFPVAEVDEWASTRPRAT